MVNLVELDSVEILVIVDNELDPISSCPNPAAQQTGGTFKDLAMAAAPLPADSRGAATHEIRMDAICCGAHGLSLLVTGVKDGKRHTVLFDTGPEERAVELNATRLRAPLGDVELAQLSHWHRDHSGGMCKVLPMVQATKGAGSDPIIVDLHPDRPDYRGTMAWAPVSLEADPTFGEIEAAGGKIEKHDEAHAVLDDYFVLSGEIPRVTGYELGLRRGIRFEKESGKWVHDSMIKDERFLMCKLKDKGILMFTGCSHAGVVNASRHALELGNGTSLYAVMGGFHLADGEPEMISKSVSDLKALDPKLLLTGHCTGWRAKFEIERQMPGRLVPSFVGSRLVL